MRPYLLNGSEQGAVVPEKDYMTFYYNCLGFFLLESKFTNVKIDILVWCLGEVLAWESINKQYYDLYGRLITCRSGFFLSSNK